MLYCQQGDHFPHFRVVDGEGSPSNSERFSYLLSEYWFITPVLLQQVVLPERRVMRMFSISELIAILGVCISAFGLGYKIGRDKRDDEREKKK